MEKMENITNENKNNLPQTEKETFFSYFGEPYKKIWNKFFKYEDWIFKIWVIRNDELSNLIEISDNIFSNLIKEKDEKMNKNKDIIYEINIALYPDEIEKRFLTLIQDFDKKDVIINALNFVKEKHKWQYRFEFTPYWTHLVLTATYIIQNNWSYEEIIASLLHDVIEDQDYEWLSDEIKKQFWIEVLNIITTLSKIRNWKKIGLNEYYSEISQKLSCIKIKACDRLANLYWTYFWLDIDWNLNYLFKTKKEIFPLIEKDFPDLVEKMNEIILYLRENIKISDKHQNRINDLKKIRELKDNL